MDSSVNPGGVAIAGYGAVTALGRGVHAIERAVAWNTVGLQPCARFAGRGYQSDIMAGIPPLLWEEIESMWPERTASRVWRLAAVAAREATHGLGEAWTRVPRDRIALVLSTTKADAVSLEKAAVESPSHCGTHAHILPTGIGADLAELLGIGGPVQCVSLACVSGVMAIQQGCSLIRRGKADVVLVVGVDVLSHFVLSGFSALKSLDPLGCRPFDSKRNGLSLGEGAGAIVLAKSHSPASTLSVTGCGSSNDANHLTGPSRDGAGLALAAMRALRSAGVAPEQIDYINAHGTGTLYNDAMESLALNTVFAGKVPPFSSAKGMLGHTLGAAGIIETIICCIAMKNGVLPGTPGLEVPDPAAPRSILLLPRQNFFPRRILKINSGFGGINGALVLETGV